MDVGVLSRVPGLFNLDYPPPAYIGDIENAPVVLLNGNGGYKSVETPLEFPDAAAAKRALDLLHNPRPVSSRDVSPYYASANYAPWLKTGELALVNAVAYRAPEITGGVVRVSHELPSALLHRRWLNDELIPAARAGRRLIVAHRNRLWNLPRSRESLGLLFTSNARSKSLPDETLNDVKQFLASRH
jgi:hypothetical protein